MTAVPELLRANDPKVSQIELGTVILDGYGEVPRLPTLRYLRRLGDEAPAYVIDRLLTNALSYLSGPPEGMKSYAVVELALTCAGYQGAIHDAGFRLVGGPRKVAIVAADDDGVREYRDRMSYVSDEHAGKLIVVSGEDLTSDPVRFAASLAGEGVSVCFVDNFNALAPGVDDDKRGEVARFIDKFFKPIRAERIAVCYVLHRSEKSGTNAAGYMGSTAHGASVRGRLAMLQKGARLSASGNRARGKVTLEIEYACDADGCTRWASASIPGQQTGPATDTPRDRERAQSAHDKRVDAIPEALPLGEYKSFADAHSAIKSGGHAAAFTSKVEDTKRAIEAVAARCDWLAIGEPGSGNNGGRSISVRPRT